MNEEELQFLGMMYDQFYNGWHVSDTDRERYFNILYRMEDIGKEK